MQPSIADATQRMVPVGIDRVVLGLALACLLILYVPTGAVLARDVWGTVEQSYGPVFLAASAWLLWQRLGPSGEPRLSASPAPRAGYALLLVGLILYIVGRSQGVLAFETFSIIPVAVALLLLAEGWPAVRVGAVPIALLLFAVPMPPDLVAALTAPLKSAVSAVAATILSSAGYPVARTGAILMVGQYQLLVADACAGLTSMFTLEAIGLVYMAMRNHTSVWRNIALGVLLIPIAFAANVLRVLILVLVTYHLGDEAGQGFVHSAAGILLFVSATLMMLIADFTLGRIPRFRADAI